MRVAENVKESKNKKSTTQLSTKNKSGISTTNVDRVVCINAHPCKGLARGEHDWIRRLENSVRGARIDNETLVLNFFQTAKTPQ